jgi:hypothetical protein
MSQKRKLWSQESMEAAVRSVHDGKGLREASRLYNVPVETLRRRVTGKVEMDCRPGPPTVLTLEEEGEIVRYLIQMADMGYGLTKEAVLYMVGSYVTKCKRSNPFKDGKAGRYWFEGFKKRHPNLTVRMPQPLSYARALNSTKEVVTDFFGKLGSLYGRLNLISKPMQVYNADETGVTIVHKPGKVITELGRRHVYSVTSAERGRTHTVLSCISATGVVLPPCIIYPRKTKVPENFREGAGAGTLFCNSENGWINSEVYLEWFDFFLKSIPPTRPVILIQDGHASHVSIQLIELARANDVYILCLPAHTTHLLQPLDIGVFKSFKVFFSKACSLYLSQHPGRVITNDKIASLISLAVPNSFTPNNIMSGFRKTGIHPLNPGVIDDKMLCPSRAFKSEAPVAESASTVQQLSGSASLSSSEKSPEACLFSPEQQTLYEQRYREGYDVPDDEYESWLRIMHPNDTNSAICSSHSSACKSSSFKTLSSSVSPILQEMLVLPQPKNSTGRKKKALNSKAVCITDSEVLDELKAKEEEKMEKQKKKSEREEQRKAKALETARRKAEAEQKRKTKESERKKRDEEKITLQTRRRRGMGDMKMKGKEGKQNRKSKREKLTD